MFRSYPARPVAAALALVLALTVPAAGEIISDIGVIPSPFSPNADGVFDSTAVYYTLSERSAVVVAVGDSAGNGLWTHWSGWEDAGRHSHWWDGWFGDTLALDGRYTFLLKALPEFGVYEEVQFPFVVDTVAPLLHFVDVAPSRFSPDGDGVGDSVLVSFEAGISEPSDQVLVTVLDEDDEPVRLIYSATGVASAELFWDGTDSGGAVAPDGLFFINVESRDAAGNAAESGALVDLDTAPPRLGVDYPDTAITELRFLTPVAGLTGWAHDRAGVVRVEMSVDQQVWYDASMGRPDSVSWAGNATCVTCVPDTVDETLVVYVRAHDGTPTADGQGHVNNSTSSVPVLSFDVIFDVAPPKHVSTTVGGGIDTFEEGDTVTLTTRWDDTGYELTADFSQVDSEFDPADVVVTETTGGSYTVTYRLSGEGLNSYAPVTDAPVVITATDAFSRSATDTVATVSVVPPTADDPGSFGIEVNSFKPIEGALKIDPGSYEGTFTVSIYTMAGTLVRTMEGQGGSPVEWRGDNDAGDFVASGVYFIRIQTGGSESVRKVAVIK